MFHKNLDPQCRKENMQEKNNIQLSATGYLKPCCFYGTSINWKQLMTWADNRGLDIENLNITKHSVEKIYNSPLWANMLLGQVTGDLPTPCWDLCRVNSTNKIDVKKHAK